MKSHETELFELESGVTLLLNDHEPDSAAVACLLRRWCVCLQEYAGHLLSDECKDDDRQEQILKLFKAMEGRHV